MNTKQFRIHPLIGCLGIFLLIITVCGFWLFQPQLTWIYSGQLYDALNQYWQMRTAVFRGEDSVSALETVATLGELDWLTQSHEGQVNTDTEMPTIELLGVKDYSAECAIVTAEIYPHDWDGSSYTIMYTFAWEDNRWKVAYSEEPGIWSYATVC